MLRSVRKGYVLQNTKENTFYVYFDVFKNEKKFGALSNAYVWNGVDDLDCHCEYCMLARTQNDSMCALHNHLVTSPDERIVQVSISTNIDIVTEYQLKLNAINSQ